MGNLKYFTDTELEGLMDPLPFMLEKTRENMDPSVKDPRIILTFTTGGDHCGHSAHYQGAAIDIGTGHLDGGYERDNYQYALVKAAIEAGFQRIEIAPAHVHLDIGERLSIADGYAAPVLWIGQEA